MQLFTQMEFCGTVFFHHQHARIRLGGVNLGVAEGDEVVRRGEFRAPRQIAGVELHNGIACRWGEGECRLVSFHCTLVERQPDGVQFFDR